MVFARYMLGQTAQEGGAQSEGTGWGNMVLETPLPDSMEGGTRNTVEKVLGQRLVLVALVLMSMLILQSRSSTSD